MVIVWSGLGITNAKGIVGGNVLSGNAAGRMASIYRKPKTRYGPTQTLQRNRFQEVVARWTQITDSQRAGWNAEAATGDWDTVNSIGETIQPSGFQLFVKLNLNLYTVDTSIDTAPSKPTLSPPLLTSMSAIVATQFRLTFSPSSISSGEHIVIFATPNTSPGRFQTCSSRYRFVQSFDSAAFGATIDIEANWEGLFGKIVEGCSIFVRATLVDGTTGDTATAGSLRAISTA